MTNNDDAVKAGSPEYAKFGFRQGWLLGRLFIALGFLLLFVLVVISGISNGDGEIGLAGMAFGAILAISLLWVGILAILLAVIGWLTGYLVSFANKKLQIKISKRVGVMAGVITGFLSGCMLHGLITPVLFANCLHDSLSLFLWPLCEIMFPQSISPEAAIPFLAFFTLMGGWIGYRIAGNKKYNSTQCTISTTPPER